MVRQVLEKMLGVYVTSGCAGKDYLKNNSARLMAEYLCNKSRIYKSRTLQAKFIAETGTSFL